VGSGDILEAAAVLVLFAVPNLLRSPVGRRSGERWTRKELKFGATYKEVADTLNAQGRLNRGMKWTANKLEETLDRDDDIRERIKNRR
jgi:hypothetical protein